MPEHGKTTQATKTTNMDDRRFLEEHQDKLSDSTLRAKWIGSIDEHADRNGQTLATRNHDVIKQWAEKRKATPANRPGYRARQSTGCLALRFPELRRRRPEEDRLG